MGDTWIVDLRHYLTPAGAFAEMPRPARRLAEFFASIVVDATSNIDGEPSVRCRRHPGHQRCSGMLFAFPSPEERGAIHWSCPVCNDNGVIRGWQNTLWDGFASEGSRPAS
jgi:hypothetical protein